METATSDKGKLKNIPEIVASVSESIKKNVLETDWCRDIAYSKPL